MHKKQTTKTNVCKSQQIHLKASYTDAFDISSTSNVHGIL